MDKIVAEEHNIDVTQEPIPCVFEGMPPGSLAEVDFKDRVIRFRNVKNPTVDYFRVGDVLRDEPVPWDTVQWQTTDKYRGDKLILRWVSGAEQPWPSPE